MSVTRDLLEGLAQYLEDARVGTYDPDAPYDPAGTAVTLKVVPATVSRAVTLTAYAPSDHPTVNLSQIRVQFWFRGSPNDAMDVDDLADEVFHLVHGMEHKDFGIAHVVQALRVSSIPMGEDDNDRHERADNYLLDVNRPATVGQPE